MHSVQKEVAQNVKSRGYWDNIEEVPLVCRHAGKLVEELSELLLELQPPWQSTRTAWLENMAIAGRLAREVFDDKEIWDDYKIRDIEHLQAELADLQVVILSMSEAMNFDVLEAAKKKSERDVGRGVRNGNNHATD